MSTCSICRILYNAEYSQQIPRALNCGHTYCSGCLERSCQQTNGFRCIKCGSVFSGYIVKQAPINFAIFQLFEQIQSIEKNQYLNKLSQSQMNQTNNLIKFSNVPLQEKCRYQTCPYIRKQFNGKKQLFCSQNCKRLWIAEGEIKN